MSDAIGGLPSGITQEEGRCRRQPSGLRRISGGDVILARICRLGWS
jgi:hypothetical protein